MSRANIETNELRTRNSVFTPTDFSVPGSVFQVPSCQRTAEVYDSSIATRGTLSMRFVLWYFPTHRGCAFQIRVVLYEQRLLERGLDIHDGNGVPRDAEASGISYVGTS